MLTGLWDRLLDAVSRRTPAGVVDSWFRPCRLLEFEGDHLKIAAPNSYSREWLVQRYLPVLTNGAAVAIGGRQRVSIVVDSPLDEGDPSPSYPPHSARSHATLESLIPRYTFDTFVVGSGNQFAQAASQAVAELPSRAYNPLFIYGGGGLGKTHLLHAVGHQTSRPFSALAAAYLSSERVNNHLINSSSD